jgi:transcription elongation GreA/GreB family factor
MSRAFVKDSEDSAVDADLPERALSPHRNLVTPRGLEQIATEIHRLERELAVARAADDKRAIATAQRDLRYWNARRANAELVPPTTDHGVVRFGCEVLLRLPSGATRALRIVGEDEADPAAGSIAYVAPVARGLLGSRVGEVVDTGAGDGEIIAIR